MESISREAGKPLRLFDRLENDLQTVSCGVSVPENRLVAQHTRSVDTRTSLGTDVSRRQIPPLPLGSSYGVS